MNESTLPQVIDVESGEEDQNLNIWVHAAQFPDCGEIGWESLIQGGEEDTTLRGSYDDSISERVILLAVIHALEHLHADGFGGGATVISKGPVSSLSREEPHHDLWERIEALGEAIPIAWRHGIDDENWPLAEARVRDAREHGTRMQDTVYLDGDPKWEDRPSLSDST